MEAIRHFPEVKLLCTMINSRDIVQRGTSRVFTKIEPCDDLNIFLVDLDGKSVKFSKLSIDADNFTYA